MIIMFIFIIFILHLHAPEEVAIATKACANKIFLNSDVDSYSRNRRETNIIHLYHDFQNLLIVLTIITIRFLRLVD